MAGDDELDPRIQIELENLNTATNDINKLEIELEEANSTFRILLNESTRRLKLLSKKLGNCIEKARPYHEACEKARLAQIECQKAAVQYQRANEIHAAAKETVALAEQRFLSNSHEWQFDGAWQEMLNHATLKVMDAEKTKAESGAEHQNKAAIFNQAEKKVQQLEERFRRSIQKSRPYFDEKQICQDQLQTQKERIHQIQGLLQKSKSTYSASLRSLEQISEEIHRQRGDLSAVAPSGVREPGVGAEQQLAANLPNIKSMNNSKAFSESLTNLHDFSAELDRCDERQSASGSQCASIATSSAVSERDPSEGDLNDDLDLEFLRQKVKTLAVRPVESADGQQQDQDIWENELNATVNKLDHLMMMRETASSKSMTPTNNFSLPSTPLKDPTTTPTNVPLKQLQKVDPLPLANVSMFNVSSISNFSFLPDSWATHRYSGGDNNNNSRTHQQRPPHPQQPPFMQNKRKLSLQ